MGDDLQLKELGRAADTLIARMIGKGRVSIPRCREGSTADARVTASAQAWTARGAQAAAAGAEATERRGGQRRTRLAQGVGTATAAGVRAEPGERRGGRRGPMWEAAVYGRLRRTAAV